MAKEDKILSPDPKPAPIVEIDGIPYKIAEIRYVIPAVKIKIGERIIELPARIRHGKVNIRQGSVFDN